MSFTEYLKVFGLFVLIPCIIFIPIICSIIFTTKKLMLNKFDSEKEKNHTIIKIILLIPTIIILIMIGLVIEYHYFN